MRATRSHVVLVQLNPPLPLEISKGSGWAHFVIDYGPEAALLWVVFMDADGACWTVPNTEVRMSYNWTMGRRKPEDKGADRSMPAKAAQPDGATFHVFSNPGTAKPDSR
jgi:hypothetical protein